MNHFFTSHKFRLWLAVFSIASMMSCGGAFRQPGVEEEPSIPDWEFIPPANGSGSGSGGTVGTPTSPPVNVPFTVYKSNSTSASTVPSRTETFNTDSIFRVRFSGEQATHGWLTNSASFSRFGCVRYTAQIDGGVQRTTETIRTTASFNPILLGASGAGNIYVADGSVCCPDAPTEDTLEFDYWVQDRGGAPVDVRVTQMQYNWRDLYQYNMSSGRWEWSCGIRPIRPGATFTGDMDIITNQSAF